MEICHDVNLDMISNLPANVTDQILVRLPIREAARTSVLSTKWRYKWTTITQLVFHDSSALPYPYKNKDRLISLIDRVLLLHSGFIHKFELSTMILPVYDSLMLDAWILFLSRKNIKEFALKFSYSDEEGRYKLPTCFFSAQQICTLELRCCVLRKPPPTFTGFSNLKSLYLKETTFVDKGGFERLISKCPLLERLTWELFDDTDHLNICSPNLKYLSVTGCLQDICFENTPLLFDVTIHTAYFSDEEDLNEFLQSETGNVVKVLSSLPSLRKFSVGLRFRKFPTAGNIPEKLPFTCHHLSNLTLELNLEDVNVICATLCLLNSSPNLRELEIISLNELTGENIENFWEERTLIDWNMSGLQIVKITNIKGFELELEFIKLLLANSPMLEMLSIRPYHNIHKRLELIAPGEKDMLLLLLLFQLLRFKRASPKAVIEFPDFERNMGFPDFVRRRRVFRFRLSKGWEK